MDYQEISSKAKEKIYTLLEQGLFNESVKEIDTLLNLTPQNPELINAYRTARFWQNREEKIKNLPEGKETADFLMKEWNIFDQFLAKQKETPSYGYQKTMRYIFFKASENYQTAFKKNENTTSSFDLLLKLGNCFLKINEYKKAIQTLEYARSLYSDNAYLLSNLAEAYFQIDDLSTSLLYFKEAFFINPSEIELHNLKADPILKLIKKIKEEQGQEIDIREWIPIYAFTEDVFYVRRNITKSLIINIEKEIYKFEVRFNKMDEKTKRTTKLLPRLINRYLWMLDYYEFQNYNLENINQLKKRLTTLRPNLFTTFFQKENSKKST